MEIIFQDFKNLKGVSETCFRDGFSCFLIWLSSCSTSLSFYIYIAFFFFNLVDLISVPLCQVGQFMMVGHKGNCVLINPNMGERGKFGRKQLQVFTVNANSCIPDVSIVTVPASINMFSARSFSVTNVHTCATRCLRPNYFKFLLWPVHCGVFFVLNKGHQGLDMVLGIPAANIQTFIHGPEPHTVLNWSGLALSYFGAPVCPDFSSHPGLDLERQFQV